MAISIGLVVIGIACLVLGGEFLLRGAVGFATLLRLTPAVIGLTVVAAGTSVPELAVSAFAAIQGKADIAVANVVGSNIFNITVVLGLVATIRPINISGNTVKLEYPVLALVTLMCVAICQDQSINWIDATLCLAVYICFTTYLVALVRQQMSVREEIALTVEVKEINATAEPQPRFWVCLGWLIAGVGFLTLGANSTLEGAVRIAKAFGLSDRIIGLTIVSIGTGLPEVFASIVSSFRGRNDVALGNIIGSNLFNILGVLGVTGLITPLSVDAGLVARDNFWMLGVTLLLFPIMVTGRRINRWEGVGFLGIYVAFLVFLLKDTN